MSALTGKFPLPLFRSLPVVACIIALACPMFVRALPSRPQAAITSLPNDERLRLAWMIRDRDCHTCASPAYLWRRIRGSIADSVEFIVLSVGADTSPLRRVLRRERIDPQVVVVGNSNEVGYSSPTLLLIRGRRVLRRWDDRSTPDFLSLVSGDGASIVMSELRRQQKRR